MTDQTEVEVKFALDTPAAMRSQLIALGAEPQGRHHEFNWRLDTSNRQLLSQGIVLRLRRAEFASTVRYTLTVKAPLGVSPDGISARREIELDVSDGDAALAALGVLGYQPYWRYEKHRETLRYGATEIVLDETPMGWFMEIEASAAEIRVLAPALKLPLEDSLPLSYAEIFENVRHRLGLSVADLTFEQFDGIEVTPELYRG